jgi:hypothetical protein
MSAITRCLSGAVSGLMLVIGVFAGVAVAEQGEIAQKAARTP